MDKLDKTWDSAKRRLVIATFCAQSISISIGINQGYSAILLPQLSRNDSPIIIDQDESSWIVTDLIEIKYFVASLGIITNPLGSILSGILAEYLGRKRSIQISNFPFLIGWLLIGFAKDVNWLYAGRLISGISGGMSSAAYTYVSEISTAETRGGLNTFGPICGCLGILIIYTLGYLFEWKLAALLCTIFPIFTLISMQFLPESPAYLIKNGDNFNSFKSYLYFKCDKLLAQKEVDNYKEINQGDSKGSYLGAETVKPFCILIGLFFVQQASGIYAILFYAVYFFEQANVNIDNNISSIILGVLRLLIVVISALAINKFGRKILCITSASGMTLSLLALSIYTKYYEINSNETRIFPLLPLFGVLLYVSFSTIGMYGIPFLLTGELFPLASRSIMGGFIICIAQIFIFLSVKAYPYMIEYFNFSGTLITYLVASFVAIIYSKFVLIETKNKSLQEIERHFKSEQTNI